MPGLRPLIILFEGLDSNTAHDLLVYCYGGKIENIEEKSEKLLAASDQVTVGKGGQPSFNWKYFSTP